MADVKISALPAAASIADADVLGGVVGGVSNKVPASVVKTYMGIPVKASGAEVDTGTDDAKFVTAKAIEDSNLVRTTNKISDLTACSSAELAGKISDETGSGKLVFDTSPTLVTPTLGDASATTLNKITVTAPASGATLTIADGKTLTVSNDATVSGTNTGDQTLPVKATGAEIDTGTDDAKFATAKAIEDSNLVRTTNKISDLSACSSSELAGKVSDETGSGKLMFATNPTTIALRETVVALTEGATPALDASLGTVFTLAAEGNRTIAVPTNAPGTGLTQTIIIRHTATGAARTLALNTGTGGFRFGSDITALTETASGKTDYIGCKWNVTDSRWDVVAYVKGF